MNLITSTQNEKVRQARSLREKKFRLECGLFLVEGEKSILEAMERHAGCSIRQLFASEEFPELEKIAYEKNIEIVHVTPQVIKHISDVATPQGCVAVVRIAEHCEADLGERIVALEDIADPGNLGSIIRSADALGASGILLSPNCCDYTAPKVVRATMGSIFHIPICVTKNFNQSLISLKNGGFSLIATHLSGKSELPKSEKSCIIIGSEATGLSKNVIEIADVLYKIEMPGRAESLNAAVAAAIMMDRLYNN